MLSLSIFHVNGSTVCLYAKFDLEIRICEGFGLCEKQKKAHWYKRIAILDVLSSQYSGF